MALFALPIFSQEGPADDWKPVEQALGRSGDRQPDGAIKFSFPRSDLHVSLQGTPIATGLAFGGWVAFFPAGGGDAMAMGDLVLTEDELPKTMTRLLGSSGPGTTVEVTAVHNHLQNETPRVMYMHISGHGKALNLAQAIAAALAMTAVPPPPPAGMPASGAVLPVDAKKIDACMGAAGKVKAPVIAFALPTTGPVSEHGVTVPASAGVNTAINLQFVSAGRTLGTGDFVLVAERVNAVAKTLTDGGIRVTALHSHMLDESPRLFFMHFWADGDPGAVCATLRKALNAAVGK
ncbi:MAG: DUF1259 domain-containing protein [Acidobacteriota bacterium]|nr:DUF1259 domain-containing protein [Acidobacteriota bacterium]